METTKFSKNLLTPHVKLLGDATEAEPLIESSQFLALHAEYNNSNKTYEDRLTIAYGVAGLIRRSLRYRQDSPQLPELSIDSITADQSTNCHGYSIIASECLTELNLPHWVGYANGHSFLLMEDKSWGHVNLIDTPSRPLCVNISGATRINRELHKEKQGGIGWLNGQVVIDRSDFTDKIKALSERPWLSFLNSRKGHGTYQNNQENDRNNQLLLRYYAPEIGRNTLLAYSNFIHNISSKKMTDLNTTKAYNWLIQMDNVYPEIDKRNKLFGPTKLIHTLGKLSMIDEIKHSIATVTKSFEPYTNDPLMNLWQYDQFRKVGTVTKNIKLLQRALDGYNASLKDSKYQSDALKKTLQNKIQKTKIQIESNSGR